MRYLCLDKDAPSVLEKLCEEYKLGIVSNFAIPEFVWTLLEKYDLKKFFNVIVISGDVNRRKPSPDIFYRALAKLNVNPCETVFVGDTLSMDVKGAKAVGMKAILIKRGISSIDIPKSSVWKPPKDNVDPIPDKTIGNLSELLDIIEDC
jgi:FMN phosphatase YigB (HAD superfamily)